MRRHASLLAVVVSSLAALASSGCASTPSPPARAPILAEMRRSAGDAIAIETASPDVARADDRARRLERATGGAAWVEPFHAHEVDVATAEGERRETLEGAGPRTLAVLGERVIEGSFDEVRLPPPSDGTIAVAMSRRVARELGLRVGDPFFVGVPAGTIDCARRVARLDAIVSVPGEHLLPESSRTFVTSNASASLVACARPSALRISARNPADRARVISRVHSPAVREGLRVISFRELYAGFVRALETRIGQYRRGQLD